jgi:hypothetical protein
MAGKGIPDSKPNPMAAKIKARKGCNLSLVVLITMKAIQNSSMKKAIGCRFRQRRKKQNSKKGLARQLVKSGEK